MNQASDGPSTHRSIDRIRTGKALERRAGDPRPYNKIIPGKDCRRDETLLHEVASMWVQDLEIREIPRGSLSHAGSKTDSRSKRAVSVLAFG